MICLKNSQQLALSEEVQYQTEQCKDIVQNFEVHKKKIHNFWYYIEYFVYLANTFKHTFYFENPFADPVPPTTLQTYIIE